MTTNFKVGDIVVIQKNNIKKQPGTKNEFWNCKNEQVSLRWLKEMNTLINNVTKITAINSGDGRQYFTYELEMDYHYCFVSDWLRPATEKEQAIYLAKKL